MTPLEAISIIEKDAAMDERPDGAFLYDMQDVVEAVQVLIDTGVIYHLQGSYHSLAQDLFEADLVTVPDVTQL